VTTPITPKKPVVGRNEADQHPELNGAHLLVSVGLKKRWSKKPTYWIEIYGKHEARPSGHPPPSATKIIRFYVFRQWSFIKGSMFDENRELVAGGFLIPTCFTQVRAALEASTEIVRKQVADKGYDVCDVNIPDEVQKATWGMLLLSELNTHKDIFFKISNDKGQQRAEEATEIKMMAKPPAKKVDFWDTARQREKKAKW